MTGERRYRVRWAESNGWRPWVHCTRYHASLAALILYDVAAADGSLGHGLELVDLEPGQSRVLAVPWHIIRGPVEAIRTPPDPADHWLHGPGAEPLYPHG